MRPPTANGPIRNFCSVIDGVLSRGEQPLLNDDAVQALRSAGISAILSLREDEPNGRTVAGRLCPPYSGEEDRKYWEGQGFTHRRVSCPDFSVPPPSELRDALRFLDQMVGGGQHVYVHCLAGVGRTGQVIATWLMSQGWSGDVVARDYFDVLDETRKRTGRTEIERANYFTRINVTEQWWAIQLFARLLRTPVSPTAILPAVAPIPPSGWEHLEQTYAEALAPWIERCIHRSLGERPSVGLPTSMRLPEQQRNDPTSRL